MQKRQNSIKIRKFPLPFPPAPAKSFRLSPPTSSLRQTLVKNSLFGHTSSFLTTYIAAASARLQESDSLSRRQAGNLVKTVRAAQRRICEESPYTAGCTKHSGAIKRFATISYTLCSSPSSQAGKPINVKDYTICRKKCGSPFVVYYAFYTFVLKVLYHKK